MYDHAAERSSDPAAGTVSALAPRPPRRVRVLVADDHDGFAATIPFTLGTDERVEVAGRAANGIEALEVA